MNENLFPHVNWDKMWEATVETLYMTGLSTLYTFIFGLLLGVLLFLSSPGQLWSNRLVYGVTGAFVNVFRSIPFIILIISIDSVHDFPHWDDPRSGSGYPGTCHRSCTVLCANGHDRLA